MKPSLLSSGYTCRYTCLTRSGEEEGAVLSTGTLSSSSVCLSFSLNKQKQFLQHQEQRRGRGPRNGSLRVLHITEGVFYGKQPTISVCRRLLFCIISSSVRLSWEEARKLIFSIKVGLLSVKFKMKLKRWGFRTSQATGKHLSVAPAWSWWPGIHPPQQLLPSHSEWGF